MQNWMGLLLASKNNWKWPRNYFDNSAWKAYVVHRSIITTFWKVTRIEKSVFKKIQETNIVLSNCSFFLVFSLRFFCVHYFSSTLLVMIRTTKRQRTNKASNINKIIYCNYNIMTKSISDATLNFPKNYWICSYVGVIYSNCNIPDSFCFR